MTDNHFTAQVEHFVTKSKAITTAVMKEGVQEVINVAQTPTAKGGHMRVDTGFLRASGQVSLTGMPSGPSRGDPKSNYAYDDGSVVLELTKAKPGDTIFFGWTANYALARESKDAFLRLAVQRWQQIIDGVVARLKARMR